LYHFDSNIALQKYSWLAPDTSYHFGWNTALMGHCRGDHLIHALHFLILLKKLIKPTFFVLTGHSAELGWHSWRIPLSPQHPLDRWQGAASSDV
jgi:hypothetical protein